MADVTLKYKGATIGELSESGNKTLKTAGKYCEADILLEYVKSGGGLPPGMTNIGSGTFTFASKTVLNTAINHGLSFTPKAVIIWTDTEPSAAELFYCLLTRQLANNTGTMKTDRFLATKSTSAQGLELTTYSATDADFFITSTSFNVGHGARFYAAGATYNWFAFA